MANYIKKTPEACSIGDTIKFTLISPYDATVYSGKIHSISDFDRARPYGDIASMHSAMLRGAALLEKELIDCRLDTYFIVKCHDDQYRPIGFQWIADGLVELISENKNFSIKLFNVSPEKAAQAMAILRNSNFICKLIEQ
jgi:hypothetical protein